MNSHETRLRALVFAPAYEWRMTNMAEHEAAAWAVEEIERLRREVTSLRVAVAFVAERLTPIPEATTLGEPALPYPVGWAAYLDSRERDWLRGLTANVANADR